MSLSSRKTQTTCYEIIITNRVGWYTTIFERDTLEEALELFEKEKANAEQNGASVDILINEVVRTKVKELFKGKIYNN